MSVQALKSLAQQAVQANDGRASVIKTASGKRYAVINITPEGTLGKLPEDARIQSLAKQIIESHEHTAASLVDKEIAYIDRTGAHYTDDDQRAHTETPINQKTFHAATQGLPAVPVYPDSVEETDERSQLTKPQIAIKTVIDAIEELDDTDTMTVEDVNALIGTPDLPHEFVTELTKLTHNKDDEDTVTEELLQNAFAYAYFGEEFENADDYNSVPVSGYLGRLQEEHLEGIKSQAHAAFKASLIEILEDNENYDHELYSINNLMSEQRTAQHAWNALEDLSRRVDQTIRPIDLSGFGGGTTFVSLDEEVSSPRIPVVDHERTVVIPLDPRMQASLDLLETEKPNLLLEAEKYGLLRGRGADSISTQDLAEMLTPEALLQAAQDKEILDNRYEGVSVADEDFDLENLKDDLIFNELQEIENEFELDIDYGEEGLRTNELHQAVLAELKTIASDASITIPQDASVHQIAAAIRHARSAQSRQDSHPSMAQRTGQALLTGVKAPFQAVAHPLVTGGRVLSAVAHPLQTLSSVGENLSWWWRGDPVKSEE